MLQVLFNRGRYVCGNRSQRPQLSDPSSHFCYYFNTIQYCKREGAADHLSSSEY